MTNLTFSNGYALLIGVGADLPITVKDAAALHDVLVNPARAAYPPEQVKLLTQTKANKNQILDSFDELITQVNNNPEATVIVYFSGHGIRVEHQGKPFEYFLVPYGYDSKRRATTAISGMEFTNKIEAINARKLVVLLDCCHAGGVPALKEPGETSVESAPLPPDLLNVLDAGEGKVVVASSTEREVSFTGSPYSVFTTCLMEALEGKAATYKKDGFARILDILIYLLNHVPERTFDRQHPFINKVLNLGDNFPLCYYASDSTNIQADKVISLFSPTTSMAPGQRQRLEQRRVMLQDDRDLLFKKVRRVRKAWITEYNEAVKFQLEQQLQEDEATLLRIESELNEIEQSLQ